MEHSKNVLGCNHWLLEKGYQIEPNLGKAILLCKLECERWLENMTVSDIDKVLTDIDKITTLFDEKMEQIEYIEQTDEYVIDILGFFYQNRRKDKDSFPKAKDIPLSVKIASMQGVLGGLTRNHLLVAAYKRIVQDYYQWETITDVLKTAARNADKFGYHISVMYDPVEVFELMADVSALLALASNMDIAANGTVCFSDLKSHLEHKSAKEKAAKSGEIRGEQKRKAQAAFLDAKKEKPTLSARKFAQDNHKTYGYSGYEQLASNLTKKELEKFEMRRKKINLEV